VIEQGAAVLDGGVEKTAVESGRRGDRREPERVGAEGAGGIGEAGGDETCPRTDPCPRTGSPPRHRTVPDSDDGPGDVLQSPHGHGVLRQPLQAGLEEIAPEGRRLGRQPGRPGVAGRAQGGTHRKPGCDPIAQPDDLAEERQRRRPEGATARILQIEHVRAAPDGGFRLVQVRNARQQDGVRRTRCEPLRDRAD
jgi:hypothetical protein